MSICILVQSVKYSITHHFQIFQVMWFVLSYFVTT